MITLTLFQVSTLLTALVSLFLGLFVFFGGQKTKLNFSWLLASIFISLWSMGLFGVVFFTNVKTAWFWQYILDIGGICVPVIYFNFLLYLTKKEKQLVKLQIFSALACAVLIILNFTPLFKTGISPKFGINYWIDSGKLYFLFPAYFIILVALSIWLVLKEYRLATDRDQKRQLMYVLMAQIFGFGGGMTNFFPQLFNVYPFGNYFVILYVIFISYAALKHHLFDIRIIATELLTFSICAFLFVKAALSNNYSELLLNGGIFIAVVIAGIMLIRSVIREVKQKEQIEKLAKEVERAYVVEKRANNELKNLDKVRNQFLVQTQHDLRTPLTTIKGYCELLLDGTFGKQRKQTIDVIKRVQTTTENKIKDVNNFLDITQFQLGKKVVALKPGVELNSILSEIVADLSNNAKVKGIFLELKKTAEKFVVEADREKLKSAIYNIVDNSIKYTQKGGVSVAVQHLKPNTQHLIIAVKDTGIGIPKEKVKTLFESAFERSDEAKKASPTGRGVGLYLSGQIIKAHNGNVWAESAGQGKGSEFFVELPVKGV